MENDKHQEGVADTEKPEQSSTVGDRITMSSEYDFPSRRISINSGSSSIESSSSSSCSMTTLTGSLPSRRSAELKEQTCCDYVSFTPRRFKASSKFRKCPREFPLLLVYVMFILLGFVDRGSFLVLFYSLNAYNYFTPPQMEAVYLIVRGVVHLMYPLAGFISDAYFGRYKVILASLNVVWVGSATLAAGFAKRDPIFDSNYEDGIWSVGGVTLIAIGYAIMGVGLAGIRVNLIPFGVDQVPEASSGELSSYFHWYYWSLAVGKLLATITLPRLYVYSFLSYVFLVMNGVVSIFILLLVFMSPRLQIQPAIGSPLRLIAGVTKSALSLRKRRPTFSAFHIGKRQPSFMDKTMMEYGGQYKVEQVEDVKTFYRILFILVSFIGYFAIFSQLNTTTIFQRFRLRQAFTSDCSFVNMEHLHPYIHNTSKIIHCSLQKLPPAVGYVAGHLLLLLLLIPLFDRVFYVCLNGWRWFSMLGRIAIGKIFILLSVICALVLEVLRQRSFSEELGQANSTITINAIRFHTDQADTLHVASDLSIYWVWPQYILFSFAELFCNITAVEFIYAQSPAAMKGLLLGLYFATAGVSTMLSAILFLILGSLPMASFCSFFANTSTFYKEVLRPVTDSQCTGDTPCMDSALCAYIIFTIVAVVSTVTFAIAAVKYKFRKRDPDPVFPFWLYPDTPVKESVCTRARRLLCFCVRDKDWEIPTNSNF